MTQKTISTISKNYARALLEIASNHNLTKEIQNDMEKVIEVINTSDDLKIVLGNTSISANKKNEIIDEIFKDKINLNVLNLLKLLTDKGRFGELEGIYNSYCDMLNVLSNKKNVEIISSIGLSEGTKLRILDKLEQKLNCEVVPEWRIEETIIGGLVFKFDDYVIDSSIRTKLESLSKNILR